MTAAIPPIAGWLWLLLWRASPPWCTLIRGEDVGVYFALFGLAAIFFFSGAHVLPTAKNNKKAIAQEWERSISDVAALLPEDFPVPARYAHPVVLQRMIRVLRDYE